MAEEMEREITFNADHWVSRYEIGSRCDYERELAKQRLEIAELRAEKISDAKDVEVYKQVQKDIEKAVEPLARDIRELQRFQKDQLIYNGVNTTTQEFMKGQIARLYSLTALEVPNSSVCPGWGDVNVSIPYPEP